MSFKCGIVGLPNVGKSSLFNRLTKTMKAEVANYPFCTIEPNVASVPVKDNRLEKLCETAKSEKIIYSTINFVDIAGLVKGASKGEGLGNKFLSHIAEVDVIIHVVRNFNSEEEEIVHVNNKIDPIFDFELIETELQLADLQKIENAKQKHKPLISILQKVEKIIQENSENNLTPAELEQIKCFNFLSLKKRIILCNGIPNDDLIEYCNKRKILCEFIDVKECSEEELNKVIKMGFDALNLINFFTVGPKETRSWAIEKGQTAPQAAGKIHTQFTKHFIAAEVTPYDDFVAGKKFNIQGKEYIVKDGDVIVFRVSC
jgi:small GTP-binding protein